MGKYYALLTAVGKYGAEKNLPSYEMDIKLMKDALIRGLNLTEDAIRCLENGGYVKTESFVRALVEFSSKLGDDDGFIYYFSGHGSNGNLCFSDGMFGIQNIVDFIEQLNVRNKIIILDCCYSGRFNVSRNRQMELEEAVNALAGSGTAVLASSSSEENSWLGPGKNHSLYTGMLTTAMTVKRRIRRGKLALSDINEEVLAIARVWNQNNPERIQHPIYRANTGGTIYFDVEKYNPYESLQIYLDTQKYVIRNVEPLSSLSEKRLAAFVLVKNKSNKKTLALMTREIAAYIRYANVFSTSASEKKFENTSARAIWCYFGYDESDMVNHRYFARSIWCADGAGRRKYFTKQKNSSVIRNVWVTEDSLYESVRKLQQTVMSTEEFRQQAGKLLKTTVSMAENYIADIREVDNQTNTFENIRKNYREWIQKVYEEYYRMTEISMPPDELHDWFNIVEDLSGCVLDMAILLNKNNEYTDENRQMIQNGIRRYNESLEKLKEYVENN